MPRRRGRGGGCSPWQTQKSWKHGFCACALTMTQNTMEVLPLAPPPDEIGQLHHCMIILFIIPAVSTCNLSITLLETDLYYLKRRQHFRQNLYFNLKFNTPLCSIVQGGGGGTNIGWGYEDVPWSWPPFSDSHFPVGARSYYQFLIFSILAKF